MKRGFSLIEVVFAIVIISISLMSVPMLLKETAKSNEYSIMQEAILATSTKMGNIISYPWDKNSYDSTNKILRTLDVSNGDSELDRKPGVNDDNLRVGHIYADKRRRFFDVLKYPSGVYPDITVILSNKRSINDFHRETSIIGGSGGFDYKDSGMSMTSFISYIDDAANYSSTIVTAKINSSTSNPITSNVRSTNIKMVQITTNMPNLGQSIVLKSYLSNIGQSKMIIRKK